MFTISDGQGKAYCDGVSRRDFLKVGALGMGGLSLPGLLQAEAPQVSTPTRAWSLSR